MSMGRQRQAWLIPIADERVDCGCAGKTVKSLENSCHTWALLWWWFTMKRRYINVVSLPFTFLGEDVKLELAAEMILCVCVCVWVTEVCWVHTWGSIIQTSSAAALQRVRLSLHWLATPHAITSFSTLHRSSVQPIDMDRLIITRPTTPIGCCVFACCQRPGLISNIA